MVGLTPEEAQRSRPPPPDDNPSIAIPGHFTVVLQGNDGTWLTIEPRGNEPPSLLRVWPLVTLIGGTLVVAVLSVWTARRILSPVDQLADAAARMGIGREPVPMPPEGLGDFAPIATAFNEMQARLKRFVDERTQMLAAVSHDLRTSLTRLKLSLESVANDIPAKRAMCSEIDEMEAMIAATLSFASGDAKGEPARSIDVASLLISICDDFADRGASVSYEGPDHAQLSCQPVMMKRALTNIVDNAVKYGHEAAASLAASPTAVVIRICDKGPGIPTDRHADAFAPFRRLDAARNRGSGGVGLGLSIARDVVHAHGGTIALASAEPSGLVVTLRLPSNGALSRG
jgi:signal transduction histidine kinase